MDRTVRMMRRTLLCAVFACPLACFSLPAALLCQLLFTLTVFLPPRRQKKLWAKSAAGFHAGLGRGLYALCLAISLSALSHAAVRLLAFDDFWQPVWRVLSVLTGILLQTSLIYHVKRAGKRHYAACLPALFLFIVCMR